MQKENLLAKRLDATELSDSYDEVCKRILTNKQILAWIIKCCVEEMEGYEVCEIIKWIEGNPEISQQNVHADERGQFVEGMNTEDVTLTEGTIYYDIRFSVHIPARRESIKLILNIETQNNFYPGYPLIKRGIYYGSRLISAQYGTEFTNAHYEKIKKVYSIWICTNPPVGRKNTITRYSMAEYNEVGAVKEKKEYYDLISVIMICLGKTEDENCGGIVRLLDVLLDSSRASEDKKAILCDEYNIKLTSEIEREVSDMCDLGLGLRQQAYEEAYEEAKVNDIYNLMEETGWELARCMSVLKVPEEQKELYENLVKKQGELALSTN